MNALKDWTTVAIILNVSTLLQVFSADVTMDIQEMAIFVLVSTCMVLGIAKSHSIMGAFRTDVTMDIQEMA